MSLILRARRDGELLIVTALGVMSLSSQRELRAFIRGHIAQDDCRAIVLDLRGAVCAVGGEDRWRLAARDPDPVPPQPVVLVVPTLSLDAVEAYCDEMSLRRLLRHATDSMALAVAWAYRRRDHWPQAPREPWFHSSRVLSL